MFKFLTRATRKSINVIEEIHNEFDTAADRLLDEANYILGNTDTAKTDKAERLKKLGFGQAKAVKETEKQRKAQIESEALSKTIVYFQTHYSNYKFITEAEVKRICEKYGLVCGAVNYYKGDVPEKNIKEIEGFELRKEDMEKRTNVDDYYHRMMFRQQQNSFMGLGFYASQPEPAPTTIETRYIKPEFKICAPAKDFDTRNMIISKGYQLQEIPDPIVLQPVKDGYLVVSKWGLEAADEGLTNEKMN